MYIHLTYIRVCQEYLDDITCDCNLAWTCINPWFNGPYSTPPKFNVATEQFLLGGYRPCGKVYFKCYVKLPGCTRVWCHQSAPSTPWSLRVCVGLYTSMCTNSTWFSVSCATCTCLGGSYWRQIGCVPFFVSKGLGRGQWNVLRLPIFSQNRTFSFSPFEIWKMKFRQQKRNKPTTNCK